MPKYTEFYFTILFLTVLTFVVRSAKKELSRCGQRPAFQESPYRIIGGRKAKPGQVPWQVIVAHKWPTDPLPRHKLPPIVCGGSIIHERWILTAAHCMQKFLAVVPIIVIGSLKSKDPKYDPTDTNIQIIPVERGKTIMHKEFNRNDFKSDIALLKLVKPIRFGNFSQPVCLPQPEENFEGRVCQASGWGVTRAEDAQTDRTSEWLNVLKLPIIPEKVCNRTHQALDKVNIIFNTSLCTLYPRNGKDVCSGDSGGPLTCRRNNGQFVQAGITSWGDRCAKKVSPAVYTKVSEYLDWIREKTGLDFP